MSAKGLICETEFPDSFSVRALRSTAKVRSALNWGESLLHGSATAAPLTPSPGR